MKIPLKKGHYFDERDTTNAPWVVIISETTANRYFANEDPIGQQILLRYTYVNDVDEEWPRQIVGVVGEVKQAAPILPRRVSQRAIARQTPTTAIRSDV
jgi:hypothetical protein